MSHMPCLTRLTSVLQITVPGGTPTTVKAFLHDSFAYDLSFIGPVVGILFGFTIFFAGLGILCLMFINYQKR